MQEHNYTDVESSTSQNGDANHQKIQADFEAGGADRKNILVPQKRGITKKMGKKCFCGTSEICGTNFSPKKTLALAGIQLQSRIKDTPKNEQKQELKISTAGRCVFGNFSIFAVNTNK